MLKELTRWVDDFPSIFNYERKVTQDVGIVSVQKRKLSYTKIFTLQKSIKLVATSSFIQARETFSSMIFKRVRGS